MRISSIGTGVQSSSTPLLMAAGPPVTAGRSIPTVLWGSLGPDSQSIDTGLERAVGKTQSLVHLAQAWAYGRKPDDTPNYAPFSAAMLQPACTRRSLVLLDWASWDITNKPDPAFSLDTIIAGHHDAFVHAWAQAAAQFAHPLLLRFDWEMNGNWWPYGAQPSRFVAAWKKLRGIFAAEGASNVGWLWCPNVTAPAGTPYTTAADKLPAYYPGDDMVDWTGFDTYNWSTGNGGPWMSFDQIMNGYPGWLGATYDTVAKIAPTRPMCVGEFGCWDDPRKPLWLVDALTNLPMHFPLVRAISYFNWNAGDGSKWPLAGDALTAFKLAITSLVYLPANAWAPVDGKPFGPPPLSVALIPDVATNYVSYGSTWDQIAATLSKQAGASAIQVATLTSALADMTKRTNAAESDYSTIQTSLQTLIRLSQLDTIKEAV